jgi:hypothetical protein
MTIEFSMRRRALQSRLLAALWLSVAVVILLCTYFTLPILANKIASSIGQATSSKAPQITTESSEAANGKSGVTPPVYTVIALALELFAVSFAGFLLGRAAFVEIELSARLTGFADALCLAGDDFERLEKAASILMPGTKYLSVPEIFSTNDLKSLLDVLKEVRPK